MQSSKHFLSENIPTESIAMYIPDLYFGPLPHFHRKKIKTLIYDPNAGQGYCPRYGDAVKDQIRE